jgi:hypothetical protein
MDHQRRYLSLCLVLSVAPAWAGNAAYEFNAGIGQTDNVTRVESGAQEDTIASAGLRFSYDQRSSRIEADVVGNIGYYEYLEDTYDSELLGNIAADLSAAIVSDTFFWKLSDNFGQVLNDPFTPATPDNREILNYLSTGPELLFALGAQTKLELGARYAMADYEDSPLDSAAVLAEGGLTRSISRGSELGLFMRYQQLEYDDAPPGSDYDQGQAFLRYDALGSRTHVRIDVGVDEIDREAPRSSLSEPLFRLEAERRMTNRSTLTLSGVRQFDSSGSAFASEQSDGGISLDTSGSRQTFDPFLHESLRLGWRYTGNRTDVGLGAGWSQQSYENRPDLDQTLTTFNASIRRAFTPNLSLRLGLYGSQSEFEVPGSDYDDLTTDVSLEWRMSRSLVTRLSYSHGDRDSDAVGGSYDENRIWLSIGYGRGEPRDRMLGTEYAVDSAAGAE